jgi:hypothetical protein
MMNTRRPVMYIPLYRASAEPDVKREIFHYRVFCYQLLTRRALMSRNKMSNDDTFNLPKSAIANVGISHDGIFSVLLRASPCTPCETKLFDDLRLTNYDLTDVLECLRPRTWLVTLSNMSNSSSLFSLHV